LAADRDGAAGDGVCVDQLIVFERVPGKTLAVNGIWT